MDCSERPVTDAILANLHGCAADARRLLGLPDDAWAADAIAAADGFVDRWQQGDQPGPVTVDPRDVPFLIGSLWGEQIVAALGWSWVQVVFNQHKDTVATAVVSPDRSTAIFPIHFVLACVEDAGVDCTIALSFGLLSAGDLADFVPGGYANVMDFVHRQSPRR
jgi:hypothetical protein